MNCFEALGVEPGNAICYSGFRKGQILVPFILHTMK
jgi:hypothetical protein